MSWTFNRAITSTDDMTSVVLITLMKVYSLGGCEATLALPGRLVPSVFVKVPKDWHL